MSDTEWSWEQTNPDRSGSSGDLAKLFRHENPKNPGVLANDAPAAPATLLAREVIQNSWDAARELQQSDPQAPQFEIEFRFTDLTEASKTALVEALDLHSLAERVEKVERREVGLARRDCLDRLGDSKERLRVLQIVERGTTGMYGPWKQARSHLFLALVSLGYTEKLKGAGGSYGYGKAGLINGSRIRTVVAYTCFRERPDEPGVTRRLLGMTYWGQHDIGGVNYTGFARFGDTAGGGTKPFENEDADEVAGSLGLERRDPSFPRQLGSTFLLIDSVVSPNDLVHAVERWWWPALHEGDFVVTVVDGGEPPRHPRPRRSEVLSPFIDAWELATIRRDSPRDPEKFSKLTAVDVTRDNGDTVRHESPGVIGLVSDLNGWSYADHATGPTDKNRVEHRSLVALTRGPRMVVEYLEAGRSEPYVRGVFIADESVDELLRRTEPKGHDSWRTTSDDGTVDAEAAAVARHIVDKIKQTVNNLRTKLKPPVPPPEDVNLPFFNEIMRRVMSGMGPGRPQPIPDTRPISIRLAHGPVDAGQGLVRMTGTASFSLTDHFKGDHALVEISIIYRFLEDDRVGEHATLAIEAPDGFSETAPGYFNGVLKRNGEVTFSFASDAYDTNWSGRLIVNGEVATQGQVS